MKDGVISIDELVSMVKGEIEEGTVQGECPVCEHEDYFGHLTLIEIEEQPGIEMQTGCLWCGHENIGVLQFDKIND